MANLASYLSQKGIQPQVGGGTPSPPFNPGQGGSSDVPPPPKNSGPSWQGKPSPSGPPFMPGPNGGPMTAPPNPGGPYMGGPGPRPMGPPQFTPPPGMPAPGPGRGWPGQGGFPQNPMQGRGWGPGGFQGNIAGQKPRGVMQPMPISQIPQIPGSYGRGQLPQYDMEALWRMYQGTGGPLQAPPGMPGGPPMGASGGPMQFPYGVGGYSPYRPDFYTPQTPGPIADYGWTTNR